MKKFFCLVLSLLILFSTILTSVSALENDDPIIGDVDLDGKLSVIDATYIQHALAQMYELSDAQFVAADTNTDGVLSIIDATVLQLHIAFYIESLPVDPAYPDITAGTMDANHAITLKNTLPYDSYTLKYEGTNGVLEGYADICTLTLSETENTATYSGLIKQNCAPDSSIKIGVYNSSGERVGCVPLIKSFVYSKSQTLYTFSATSDVHIGYNTAEDDFKNALTYFNNDVKVDFNCIAGDLTLYGKEDELTKYKNIVDQYSPSTEVYVSAGNHEEYKYTSNTYLEQYIENPLFYYFTQGDDVFIMVGIMSSHEDRLFDEGELQWLYEVLEENRNKRCFVFQHVPTYEGSGDPFKLHSGCKLKDYKTSVSFKNLMSHYKNAIHLHGHTHMEFEMQNLSPIATYDNVFGTHSIHIPSLAVPRTKNAEGKLVSQYEKSQAFIVDVFEDGVLFKGIDLVANEFLPVAQYYLDTTIVDVPAGTFKDSTGIINP